MGERPRPCKRASEAFHCSPIRVLSLLLLSTEYGVHVLVSWPPTPPVVRERGVEGMEETGLRTIAIKVRSTDTSYKY